MSQKSTAVPEVLKVGTNEMELVVFSIHNMLPDGKVEKLFYGVNVAKVREIIQKCNLTRLPDMPDYADSLADVRGEIVPIVDLGKWLKVIPPAEIEGKQKIIILDMLDTTVGIIVHEVQRIRRIGWDGIKPPPSFLQAKHAGKVTGVAKLEGNGDAMLLILDLENIIMEMGGMVPRHQVATEEIESVERKRFSGTILIVDDSAVARKILRDTLESAGLHVIEAMDGSQALTILKDFVDRIGKEPITKFVQCVVCDIEMPEMDGLTFTRNAKSDPKLSDLPIIINTSLSGEENRQKAVTVGADGYMVKFDVTNLLSEISRLIP
jgi:two-component system, chemotaxis family, chemotaxis protein CheV